jgi:hypothetical protein
MLKHGGDDVDVPGNNTDDGSTDRSRHGSSNGRSSPFHDEENINESHNTTTLPLQSTPPSPSSSTASQYSGNSRRLSSSRGRGGLAVSFETSTTTPPYSSSGLGGGIPSNSSHSTAMFSALSSNLMRSQHERDPMVYVQQVRYYTLYFHSSLVVHDTTSFLKNE